MNLIEAICSMYGGQVCLIGDDTFAIYAAAAVRDNILSSQQACFLLDHFAELAMSAA